MRYAILVCGPAGSGKSTFCSTILTHAQATGRVMHLFNLDPAAEFSGDIQPTLDIRDLVGLDEVMEDLDFGPNGGLVYCFECVAITMQLSYTLLMPAADICFRTWTGYMSLLETTKMIILSLTALVSRAFNVQE